MGSWGEYADRTRFRSANLQKERAVLQKIARISESSCRSAAVGLSWLMFGVVLAEAKAQAELQAVFLLRGSGC